MARRGLTALALAAVALAGCGDDEKFTPVENGGGEAAAKVLAAAPAKTRKAGSAKVFMSVAGAGTQIFHAGGISRLDRERTLLHMTFDVAIQGLKAGTKADGLIVNNDLYMKVGSAKRWVHLPSDNLTFSTGLAQSLRYLSAVTGNAKPAGEADVHGSRARVYAAVIDLDRVADNLPASERASYRKKRETEGLPARLPVKAAIDEQGRITRMDYVANVRGAKIEIRFDLYDFGAKADYSVPKHFVEAG
jgi:hypothetical protein